MIVPKINFPVLSVIACGVMVFIANILPAQVDLIWNDPIIVRQSSYILTAPRIKTLGDGNVVAVWGESSNPAKIWCSRLENGQFTAPVSVVTTTPAPALFGIGGFDVAIYGQTIYVVFERSPGGIFLTTSNDGGLTFETPVNVQGAISGGSSTLANITTDEAGNIYVNYIQEKSGIATQQMRRSTDGGQTFSTAVEANMPADGTEACECCIASPVAANGSVWLAFRNNNANIRDHWVSRSTDMADTFDVATDVDDSDWLVNMCPISAPRMAMSGDSLVVAWKTGAGGGSRVFVSSLNASTMVKGQQVRLGDPAHFSASQNLPDITAQEDTIGVVFQEDKRILFDFSTSGLSGLGNGHTHFEAPGQTLNYPSVAFQHGQFHVIYANTTSLEVIYQSGYLSPTSSTSVGQAQNNEISLSPNPVTEGSFWIKSETKPLRAYGIMDVAGRLVSNQLLHGQSGQIDVASLPAGLYFLKIQTSTDEIIRLLSIAQ